MLDTGGLNDRVTHAHRAQRSWEDAGIETRLRVLADAGAQLAKRKEELYDALAGDGLSRRLATYYGGWIVQQGDPGLLERYARDLVRRIDTDRGAELMVRRPDGVVLLVAPAHSPTINACSLFSILLPGNAAVVRSPLNDGGVRFIAEQIIGSALERHGFSTDLVAVVAGSTREIVAAAMPMAEIRTVVFFGNSRAGRSVAAAAAEHGKKVVLELEGSDHLVVWRDAALDDAVSSALHAFDFSTLPCPVPKHLLVHADVFESFLDKLIARLPEVSVTVEADRVNGNLGPVPRPEAYHAALDQVRDLGEVRAGGYHIAADGTPDDEGPYVAPTLVALEADDVIGRPLLCFDEEIFFPLIPVVRFSGDAALAQMTEIISQSPSGLRASVWTRDPELIDHFTRRVGNVGLLVLNDNHALCPAYASPWGGPRRSGGPNGENALFWEKTSHLQAIACHQLDAEQLDVVVRSLGVPDPGRPGDEVGLQLRDGVAHVELRRPHRHNAFDVRMKDAMAVVAESLHRCEVPVRAVVITGAGRSFCSGADVSVLHGFTQAQARSFMLEAAWSFRSLERLPAPVIAAVRGNCLGGGFELALHCDWVIAAHDAVFGFPETRLGLVTTAGAVERLSAVVGAVRARELLLSGRRIDAHEALRIGLVAQVVPSTRLEAAVDECVQRIVTQPPQGIEAMKRLLRQGRQDSWIAEVEAFDELLAVSR